MIKQIRLALFCASTFVIATLSFADYQFAPGDRVVQDYQSIARGWEKLRNYPAAIAAYRALINGMPHKKFAVADASYQIGRLYQQQRQFYLAIDTYDVLIKQHKVSSRWEDCVYQQALCYQTVQEYRKAYENFKAYISYVAGKQTNDTREKRLREIRQIVQQLERDEDEDEDGYMLYQEQEAGTSDQDESNHPVPLTEQKQ